MAKAKDPAFVRPEWLGLTLHNSYKAYGDDWQGTAWFSIPASDHPTHSHSLYATHSLALQGNAECLHIMKRYYLALVTKRIKR